MVLSWRKLGTTKKHFLAYPWNWERITWRRIVTLQVKSLDTLLGTNEKEETKRREPRRAFGSGLHG